jgi:hypothetical protein
MPIVLRDGPYRFYFYSHEPNEPSHVFGLSTKKLRQIQELVAGHAAAWLEAWHGHLGAGG